MLATRGAGGRRRRRRAGLRRPPTSSSTRSSCRSTATRCWPTMPSARCAKTCCRWPWWSRRTSRRRADWSASTWRTETRWWPCARELLALGVQVVLVKGGHLDGADSPDCLLGAGAPEPLWLEGDRIPGRHTHGTGCVLSAAITAELARGRSTRGRLPRGQALRRTRHRRGCGARGRRRTGEPRLGPRPVVIRSHGIRSADPLHDLAGLDAGRADVDPLGRAVHDRADALDVRVPAPLGAAGGSG